jgi:hypothetical protein
MKNWVPLVLKKNLEPWRAQWVRYGRGRRTAQMILTWITIVSRDADAVLKRHTAAESKERQRVMEPVMVDNSESAWNKEKGRRWREGEWE